MIKKAKLIEDSAIMLKELDSLRHQKREWELERANLLAEQAYAIKERQELCTERFLLKFNIAEYRRKLNLPTHRHDDVGNRMIADGPNDPQTAEQYGLVTCKTCGRFGARYSDGHLNEVS